MPAKQDTNPRNNKGQVKTVEVNKKAVYSMASLSAVATPSCTGVAPISSYSTSPKGTKGGPSRPGSIAGPHITRSPTSFIRTSLGGTPNSSASLDARSCLSQKRFSSSSVIHCGIGSYHSLGSLNNLYLPWWKWSLNFHSESQACQRISISLKKRLVGRGKRGGR